MLRCPPDSPVTEEATGTPVRSRPRSRLVSNVMARSCATQAACTAWSDQMDESNSCARLSGGGCDADAKWFSGSKLTV